MGAAAEDLMKRFHDLEVSQAKLRDQLHVFLRDGGGAEERRKSKENRRCRADQKQDMMMMAGNFVHNPYQLVLHQLGPAVHVCRPDFGEIIYWNRAAEVLYGWKSFEALNRRVTNLLIDDCNHPYWERIMERACGGETWRGQFSFRKRSGELFMALATANPLYENGACIGVITVSSDVSMLDNSKSEKPTSHLIATHSQPEEPKLNLKRVPWPPQPQITSSVSNLAGRVLTKLHILVNGNQAPELERSSETNSAHAILHASLQNDQQPKTSPPNDWDAECCASCYSNVARCMAHEQTGSDSERRKEVQGRHSFQETGSSASCKDCCIAHLENNNMLYNGMNLLEDPPDEAKMSKRNASRRPRSPKSLETTASSQTDSSTMDDLEPDLVGDSEIRWEDLVLGEEIGEGSFAIVYRGLWNGSDVAIKVYARMDFRESVLLDYKKEIAIMKKLRHPNVLLFMGAVYSPERLAIVTEYLPRGSLFRTLHKSNQPLDLRRRLRMALDVVRGINYLHRRNPPIIHRDLKSSNLLVDKSWTVKVGDFGLSCLKISTVLTAKTGRGTPQWMAPEVLRGECSSEKSDVFSFGVILWELMTESIPWNHLNSMQVVGVVGFMDRRLDIPEGIDSAVAAIISDCWASDPLERPSFQDLVERVSQLMGGMGPPLNARRRLELPPRALLPDCRPSNA